MNLERFEKYLSDSRGASEVTIQAYVRDVKYFEVYLKNKDIDGAEQAKSSDIAAYLMDLKESGKSNSTINRKLAAIRAIQVLHKRKNCRHKPYDGFKSL